MAVVAVAVAAVGIALYAVTRTAEIPGQKLGNIAQQTAKEGEPRQVIFGIVRPIGGNLVAVQEPPRIERRKQKSGGKGGGGGSSSTVEVPRRTYAVGICEGPVTGIRRAWRNNKLVYDGRGTEWGAKNNGTFLSRFQFYLGDWDQMPSPNLEAVFGAGNVPAMRGTCYMVAKDEDLQDTGGAVPQWIFEVERAYGYGLTSRPYPVETDEKLSIQAAASEFYVQPDPVRQDAGPEYLAPSAGLLFARLTVVEQEVSPEYLAPSAGLDSARLTSVLQSVGPEYLAPSAGLLFADITSILYTTEPEYLAPSAGLTEAVII